jgi:flagellar assembly protein FliH
MSARVLPPVGKEAKDGNAAVSPILWRLAGGAPAVLVSTSQPIVLRAEGKTGEADLQALEQRVQVSHQEGYAAGIAAGKQQATDRMQPVLASFAGMIQELAQLKKKFRRDAESSTVGLALAVARRVLYREMAADPEAILGLVKAAFDKCNARETHRLMVSPADLAVIQEHAPRLGFPSGLELASDAKLPRGSVVFETSRGDLDASIDTQLLEIERGFTDIIRRRPV